MKVIEIVNAPLVITEDILYDIVENEFTNLKFTKNTVLFPIVLEDETIGYVIDGELAVSANLRVTHDSNIYGEFIDNTYPICICFNLDIAFLGDTVEKRPAVTNFDRYHKYMKEFDVKLAASGVDQIKEKLLIMSVDPNDIWVIKEQDTQYIGKLGVIEKKENRLNWISQQGILAVSETGKVTNLPKDLENIGIQISETIEDVTKNLDFSGVIPEEETVSDGFYEHIDQLSTLGIEISNKVQKIVNKKLQQLFKDLEALADVDF